MSSTRTTLRNIMSWASTGRLASVLKWKYVLALVLGVGLSIYSPFLPAVVITLLLVYALLDSKLLPPYLDSKFLLCVMTLFTYVAVLSLLVIICSAVSNVSLHTVIGLELLIFVGLLLYDRRCQRRYPRTSTPRPTIMPEDMVSVIVAMLAFALMAVAPLSSYITRTQQSNVLTLVTGNVDYGTHLAMYNDYLDFGTVRLWSTPHPARSIAGGFYPSSWHAANAVLSNTVEPGLKPGPKSAAVLGAINAAWLAVVVFVATRLACSLYRLFGSVKHRSWAFFGMGLLSLITFYLLYVELMRFGFFTFTPQLIAILLLVYCLQQCIHGGIGRASALGLSLLYCSVSSASWVLLLPAAAGAVVIAMAMAVERKRPDRASLLEELRASWPLATIALASVIAQLWLMLTATTAGSVGLGQGLLIDGGTPLYDQWVYAAMAGGFVAAVTVVKRSKMVCRPYEPILAIASATLLLTSLEFIYQTYYTGTTHYYFYKSLLLLPAVLFPLGIAMVGVLIAGSKTKVTAALLAVVFPAAVLQLLPSDTSMMSFLQGKRDVSVSVMSDVWREMGAHPPNTGRVTIYLTDSYRSSAMAMVLVQANRPHNPCFDEVSSTMANRTVEQSVEYFTTKPIPQSCRKNTLSITIDRSHATAQTLDALQKYDVSIVPD